MIDLPLDQILEVDGVSDADLANTLLVDRPSPVLLCGEDNPLSTAPEFALYPAPSGCSGHRLMQILGLPEDDYCAIARMNLCDGSWSMRAAKDRAAALCVDRASSWRTIVLLGRKVADAFGYELPFFTSAVEPKTATWPTPITLVSLPHPSGRNASNWTQGSRARARAIMREIVPAIAWGSV